MHTILGRRLRKIGPWAEVVNTSFYTKFRISFYSPVVALVPGPITRYSETRSRLWPITCPGERRWLSPRPRSSWAGWPSWCRWSSLPPTVQSSPPPGSLLGPAGTKRDQSRFRMTSYGYKANVRSSFTGIQYLHKYQNIYLVNRPFLIG